MKFILIEEEILLNMDLSNTDRVLYGYIVALSQNDKSCCFASSKKICELMNLKKRQLNKCLAKLKKYNYIKIEIIKNKRYITPTINEFLKQRAEENNILQSRQLFDYNWLEED